MSQSFVNFTNQATTAASLAATKPTGTADDDVLIALVLNYIGAGSDVNAPPAGWTLETNHTWRVGNDSRARLYTKKAAGEGASWSWGVSGSAPIRIYVTTWREVCLAAPGKTINSISSRQIASGPMPVAGTAITPTVDHCLIVAFGILRNNGASQTAPSVPAGYSTAFAAGDSTFAAGEACAYLAQDAAASSGALEFSQGGSSDGSVVHTIALAPRPTPRSLAVVSMDGSAGRRFRERIWLPTLKLRPADRFKPERFRPVFA